MARGFSLPFIFIGHPCVREDPVSFPLSLPFAFEFVAAPSHGTFLQQHKTLPLQMEKNILR